ncbi:sulfatase-like hydrolase/transferase [candidate division TA06 bacterium]|nr:sulfatase-like hydrolase/transferase [candidate division TA06 bacterium]
MSRRLTSNATRRITSWTTWMVLSALVAFLEIDVTSVTSAAFCQYLRDTPLLLVYGNFFALIFVYVAVGGLIWIFCWIVSWIKEKEGEIFFTRHTLFFFGTLFLTVYGFWALKNFLFLRGFLHLFGLIVLTMVWAVVSGGLAWVFQKGVSKRLKKECVTILIFVTLAIPFFLRGTSSRPVSHAKVPNVVILSVDTLRPDHLGFWGYEKARTPHLDRLAAQGVVFRNAYAQIPLTAPSFTSIMTGLYPKTHGCRANLTPLNPSVITLAEVFKGAGYQTAAFVSGYPLKREFCGLFKGFDLYQDRFSFYDGFTLLRFLERFRLVELQLERRAEAVSRLSIPWIRRHKKSPFFVWIHYYDPHVPYRPPLSEGEASLEKRKRHQRHLWGKGRETLSSETIDEMTALYDGEIAYVDQDIGRILSFLEQEGLKEKTLLVFVSDHGEAFDHEYYFDHGDRLYESCIRIPVIFSYPGHVPENVTIDRVIQSIDLFPTILSLLELPERRSEGENVFMTTLSKKSPSVYAELSRRPGYPTRGDLWVLREDSWKLIYSPEGRSSELYDLSRDPEELHNLSVKRAGRTKAMTEQLIRWMGAREEAHLSVPVEALAREKLKSLGYLQ